MCTSATHGAAAWPGADVAPRRPESCQSVWCDSVTLTVVTRLTGLFHRCLSRCAMLDGVTHEGVTSTTMARLVCRIWLPFLFLPPLFFSSFLLLYSSCGGSIDDFKFPPKI
jgi:hypothetical protein